MIAQTIPSPAEVAQTIARAQEARRQAEADAARREAEEAAAADDYPVLHDWRDGRLSVPMIDEAAAAAWRALGLGSLIGAAWQAWHRLHGRGRRR